MVTTTRGSARRTVPAALAALALAGGALIAGSAATSSAVGSSAAVTRVAGPDRYATTAALSAATFSPGVPVAYLVSGNDFAGALVAVAAAGGQGPVLFTRPNVLAPATAAELRRLAPRKLIVLASVGDAVAAAASAAANTAATRLGGADPYATAAAVSAVTFPTGGSVAYLAGASDIADGLSGAAAASGSGPMLFVGSSSLPKATASELGRLAPKRLVVLGGPESVSDAVASAAARSAGGVTVTRLGGPDRYATSVQVSTATFADGVRVSASPSASEVSALPTNAARATVAFLATGADFPDALAAAAAAAGRGPVLLVGAKTLPDVVAGELRRLHVSALTVVGGTGAVGARVARVAAAVTAQPIPAPKAGAAAAIALAKAQLGKPYVWGGAGPASFDCSGLTRFAWLAGGVSLGHNTTAQDEQVVSVPLDALAPGDLIFYGTSVVVDHVALYAGAGLMIEAPHTGANVRLVPVRFTGLLNVGRP